MKKDFLKNLKVGDQALPDEVVDAILAENTRDVEAAKEPIADYQTIKGENQRLKSQQGDGLVDGKSAQQWKEAHDKAVSDHKAELAGVKFQHTLDAAITGAKGKNAKAITALLDVEALKSSEDQQKAISTALEGLKKSDSYLFGTAEMPPPYSAGTGTGSVGGKYDAQTAAIRSAAGLNNE